MTNGGILRKNHFLVYAFQKIVDSAVIVVCLVLSTLFYQQQWNSPRILILAFCAIVLYSFFAKLSGLNTSWRAKKIGAEFQPLIYTWIGMVLCLLLLGYATKTTATYSRLPLRTWLIVTPIRLLLVKIAVRIILFLIRA